MRRLLALTCAAAGLAVGASPATAAAASTLDVQVLAINDFHGHLEPPSGSSGLIRVGPQSGDVVPAGGAAYLATHFERLREGQRRSFSVGAGDLIGGSPLVSGLFHDEPTVEALNLMGLDTSGVGNHEFDEGWRELLRMQNGGCHPADGCQDGDPFFGADFQWLAANVRFAGTGRTVLPRYWVRGAGSGVKVGFIGLTLEETPTLVTPAGVEGLVFDDEVQTVNRYAERLARRGVRAIVVLIHQGGLQNPPFAGGFANVNGCENRSGDIWPIVDGLSDHVDAVVSAHTHQAYNCRVPDPDPEDRDRLDRDKLVTSAASFGRLITDLRFKVRRRSGEVEASTATNHIVTRDVEPDPEVQALVDRYKTLAEPIAGRVIGVASHDLLRAQNAAGESSLGDVIADSQLAATSAPDTGGAQVAFMNPGGIRTDILAGEITYAELFAVQPFGNTLVVKTLTGAQIKALLEQQFDNPSAGAVRILQVSEGFSYAYDLTRPAGSRVDAASITLDGTPIAPTDSVRVTMNSFLASGGDNFTVFKEGTDVVGGPVDIDAFAAYIEALGTVDPGPQDRIVRTG